MLKKKKAYDEIKTESEDLRVEKDEAETANECNADEKGDCDKEQDNNQIMGQGMAIGMCIGMCIGMAFGSLLGNTSMGMCMGICVGMLVGIACDKAGKTKK